MGRCRGARGDACVTMRQGLMDLRFVHRYGVRFAGSKGPRRRSTGCGPISEDRPRRDIADFLMILSCNAMPKPVQAAAAILLRSEEHTSELQSLAYLVC